METTTINVDKYYLDRSLYGVMPRDVFDALEAAFLAGEETAAVPTASYNAMLYAMKRNGLCLE